LRPSEPTARKLRLSGPLRFKFVILIAGQELHEASSVKLYIEEGGNGK